MDTEAVRSFVLAAELRQMQHAADELGVTQQAVMSVAMNVADTDRAGMVSGTVTSFASIGGGVGTSVLGVLYNARTDGIAGDTPGARAVLDQAIASGASTVLLVSATWRPSRLPPCSP